MLLIDNLSIPMNPSLCTCRGLLGLYSTVMWVAGVLLIHETYKLGCGLKLHHGKANPKHYTLAAFNERLLTEFILS